MYLNSQKNLIFFTEFCHNNACDALDLVSLFNGLTLFDDRIERINVKDMFCQEFIDRIGKLYKPVVMEQVNSITKILSNSNVVIQIEAWGCEPNFYK